MTDGYIHEIMLQCAAVSRGEAAPLGHGRLDFGPFGMVFHGGGGFIRVANHLAIGQDEGEAVTQ